MTVAFANVFGNVTRAIARRRFVSEEWTYRTLNNLVNNYLPLFCYILVPLKLKGAMFETQ
jgi:hypothetical protein